MLKLSVSNIAWKAEDDGKVYDLLNEFGFKGLDIAPTRIFPEAPYDRCDDAKKFASDLKKER